MNDTRPPTTVRLRQSRKATTKPTCFVFLPQKPTRQRKSVTPSWCHAGGGGARDAHAPRISSGASASDREKSGGNDQSSQSDDDREDDRRDGSDLKGGEHAEASEDNDQSDENGSRGGGLGHGGGGFSLDDLVHGVLLVSVFARKHEACPARQRVCGPVGPCRPGGQRYQKREVTRGRPPWCSSNSTRIPPRGLYRASPCKAWHKHRKKLLKHCFINEKDMREDQWRTFLFVQVCPSGDSTRAHSVTRLVPHSQLGGP